MRLGRISFERVQSVARRAARLSEALRFYLYNHVISRLPHYGMRVVYLRHILQIYVGTGTAIHMGCFFTGGHTVVGDRSVLNRRCYLDGRGGLKIGNDVSISPEVYIISATHEVNSPNFGAIMKPVTIEDQVWIGARAIILPGVTLAKGSVVGAGSVVTRSTSPYSVVAGNPARQIKTRSSELTYQLRYFPWFDTDIGL